MRVGLKTLVISGVIAVTGAPLVAQGIGPSPGGPGDWRLIGRAPVSSRIGHDEIVVRGPFDEFQRIKFVASDAPLRITDITVTFDMGDALQIDVRQDIRPRGESRAIDIRRVPNQRVLSIEFWYDMRDFEATGAQVAIFGSR